MTPKLDVTWPQWVFTRHSNNKDMKCICNSVGATQTQMEESPSIDLFTHSRLVLELTVHDNKGDLSRRGNKAT